MSTSTQEQVLGVDLGFVQTKAVGAGWQTKFPSIVKPRSEVAVSGLEDAEGFAVAYDSQVYNVGSKGSYDFKSDRLTHGTDIAKLLAIFGQFQETYGTASVIDLLVTGLPVFEFNDYKDSMRNALTQVFQYSFNGTKRLLNVQETLVIPQSAGAYFDFILDVNGEPVDTAIASEDVLVFDAGGKTSDACIMEASKYSQDSFTVFHGVWKAQQELRRLIMKEFRYTLKPYEVDAVMRTNKLRLGNEEHDVRKFVYTAVATVYPEIRDELTLYIDDFRRFAVMLLAGGGSYVFKDFLEEDVSCPIQVIENPEYANASGYRKYGLLYLANR